MKTQRTADNQAEVSGTQPDFESVYPALRNAREALERYKKQSRARMINEEEG